MWVVTALAQAMVLPCASGVGAVSGPTLSLSSNVLIRGQSVQISGSGWPIDSSLQATLCGASALDGIVDCAKDVSVTFSPDSGGSIAASLPVVYPQQPCPCVVRVVNHEGYERTIPVLLAGALPTAVKPDRPLAISTPRLTVRIHVSGGMTIQSLLGAPAPRTLEVTIHNGNTKRSAALLVSAYWGRADTPSRVVTTLTMAPLGPGSTRRLQFPFHLGLLSFGTYHVAVQVLGSTTGDKTVIVMATTSTWPYGLLALLLICIALLLWRWRRKVKRPAHRRSSRFLRRRSSSWRSLHRGHTRKARSSSRRTIDEGRCARCSGTTGTCTIRYYELPPPDPDYEPVNVHLTTDPEFFPRRPVAETNGHSRPTRRGRLGP